MANDGDVNELAAAMYDAAVGKVARANDGGKGGLDADSFLPYDSLPAQAKLPFTLAAEQFLAQDFDLSAAQVVDEDKT